MNEPLGSGVAYKPVSVRDSSVQSSVALASVAGAIHDAPNTFVPNDRNLYDALETRNLLLRPRFPSGMGWHLIAEGQIGLVCLNGAYKFLSPGRYTFWNPLDDYLGVRSITESRIDNGNVTIAIIRQGELGLSHCNGITHILQPGRHILQSPHIFEGVKLANLPYINLGTYHRILVPAGQVAIAFDGQHQMIITHEKVLRVSDETDAEGHHRLDDVTTEYKRGGIFEIQSDTFSFNERTGFKDIQLQALKIDNLVFQTRDGSYSGTVDAFVNWQITEPYKAFLRVGRVDEDVKLQAEANLRTFLGNLTFRQLSTPPAQIEAITGPKKEKEVRVAMPIDAGDDLHRENVNYTQAVESACQAHLSEIVSAWGVGNVRVQIVDLKPNAETRANISKTAQSSMEAQTKASTASLETQAAVAGAQRKQQEVEIAATAAATKCMTEAKAAADAVQLTANAALYQAQKSAEAYQAMVSVLGEETARIVAIKEADAKIASALAANSGNIIYVPHNLAVGTGSYSMSQLAPFGMLAPPQQQREQVVHEARSPAQQLSSAAANR